jgi:uncharacterized protein (UPF0548 family)
VVVGLGLAVASRPELGPSTAALARLRRLHPVAAIAAIASIVMPQGWPAGVVAATWAVFTCVVALVGAGRLLSRRSIESAVGIDLAMMLLAVGGLWLVISRAGLTPLGFDPAIVELTAVHFHYAGFALPIAAGAAGTRAATGAIIPLAAAGAVPLTAVGITVGGPVETAAATVMALVGLAVAVLLVRVGIEVLGAPRLLLVAAGVALSLGMALALVWAWSVLLGFSTLGLSTMARTHGSLNGLGLGVAGLAGLALLPPQSADRRASHLVVHLGRRPAPLRALHEAAVVAPLSSDPALLALDDPPGHERFRVVRPLGVGDLDAAHEGFREWAAQRSAGIAMHPPVPVLVEGSTLALLGPLGPLSFSATCRITQVIDDADRVGFVYTTLPHHPEEGSESFIVRQEPDGHLVGEVEAVWRPASLATAWCRPLTRRVQRRYVERYLDGIEAAILCHPTSRSDP